MKRELPALRRAQQSRDREEAESMERVSAPGQNPSLTVGARLSDAQQSRVPVDFGDEPVCCVLIQRLRPLRRMSGMGWRLGFQNSRAGLQSNRRVHNGFTLVEILVVLVLLSLIVFALMAVFAGTQRAFRASLTQSDTLEGGRAVMDLIANDLQNMTPCYSLTNVTYAVIGSGGSLTLSPINFSVNLVDYLSPPSPLFQPLVGSPSGMMRTNLLENIFILSKGNINGLPSWIGTGYSVSTNLADGTLYPLYRFYFATNMSSGYVGLTNMYQQFQNCIYTNSAEWSHLMDGVVDLSARAYDTGGVCLTNGYVNPLNFHGQGVFVLGSTLGVSQCYFMSNAVPASVQIELGTMEDHTLRHAEGLSGVNQSNYLANAAGQVHMFRQRVWIRNIDLTAYEQ